MTDLEQLRAGLEDVQHMADTLDEHWPKAADRMRSLAQTILDQAAEIERLREALGSAAEVVEKLPYPDWSRKESRPLARGFNWCKREASKAIRAALQENSDD